MGDTTPASDASAARDGPTRDLSLPVAAQPSTSAGPLGPSPRRNRPPETSWRVAAVWPSRAGERE